MRWTKGVAAIRRFKELPSVDKSYEEQGEIFFLCRNYAKQSRAVRGKIDRLCREAGGEYAGALKRYLTTADSWERVVVEEHISEGTLHRCRKKFYESW